MNNPELIHQANEELITKVLQQLLQEKPQLLASVTCQCHLIDPNKMRILLWKDTKEGQTIYILKVAEQKFVGTERLDKRGAVYWKFREMYESESPKEPANQTKPAPETKPTPKPNYKPEPYWTPYAQENKPLSDYPKSTIDKVTKFQERQAKAQAFQNQKASEPVSPEIKESYANNSTNSEATATINSA
ncbi:hypothetical protein [endosymbiont GvMRE of Glomus versiforme]|uniref:hypothetical protein n=1 Tax=endosymbiont GvMRE of Glomus versiforme TaxID=2039283 RepID=UPI000EBFF119|nr:hypothetical protein [endosymbiont GvMRE of Glomus versiforme]RHZ36603.1 hypothetical protein GvMRE_I2g556 [endosymbiont GvMRE of Glomus versiforme]RHZ37379.1 hypothetical protein GvMRE_I1g726 [endosymbiont GvMRE of Glomus versiforme]